MEQPYVELFAAIVRLFSTETQVPKLFPIRRGMFTSRCDGILLLASKLTSDVSPDADLHFLCRKNSGVFAQRSPMLVNKDLLRP